MVQSCSANVALIKLRNQCDFEHFLEDPFFGAASRQFLATTLRSTSHESEGWLRQKRERA